MPVRRLSFAAAFTPVANSPIRSFAYPLARAYYTWTLGSGGDPGGENEVVQRALELAYFVRLGVGIGGVGVGCAFWRVRGRQLRPSS